MKKCAVMFFCCMLCCGTLCLMTFDISYAKMIVRDVPLNKTDGWNKRMAMLQQAKAPVPSLPITSDTRHRSAHTVKMYTTTTPRTAPKASLAPLPTKKMPIPLALMEPIQQAGARHGISTSLLAAVLKTESNFNPKAISSKGARGLMQIMPQTAKELGLKNSFDIHENIDAGAQYLAKMLKEFKDTRLALAAYNAGPSAVRKHGGIPPYDETQNYVSRVLYFLRQYTNSSAP